MEDDGGNLIPPAEQQCDGDIVEAEGVAANAASHLREEVVSWLLSDRRLKVLLNAKGASQAVSEARSAQSALGSVTIQDTGAVAIQNFQKLFPTLDLDDNNQVTRDEIETYLAKNPSVSDQAQKSLRAVSKALEELQRMLDELCRLGEHSIQSEEIGITADGSEVRPSRPA